MKSKGHSHRRIVSFIIYGLLIILNWSCASLNTPLVFRPKSFIFFNSTNDRLESTWTLDSLSPSEGTTLIKRRKVVISVNLDLHGQGEYLIQLSKDRKNYKPLPYTTITGSGYIDLSGRISWFIRPRGKSEIISIALYRVEKSKTGRTENCTLLKQIRREYIVKGNHKTIHLPLPASK